MVGCCSSPPRRCHAHPSLPAPRPAPPSQVGDSVAPGDVYCEVETDKATISWESQEEGESARGGGVGRRACGMAGCCSVSVGAFPGDTTRTAGCNGVALRDSFVPPPNSLCPPYAGFIARILLSDGSKDIEVGTPVLVLVEEKVRREGGLPWLALWTSTEAEFCLERLVRTQDGVATASKAAASPFLWC